METIDHITIGWEKGDKFAEVDAFPGRLKNKIQKLHEKYPDEFKYFIENEDGSLYAEVPVRWIKISPPRKVSDEQREAVRERFAQMRETVKALRVENPNSTLRD